MTIATTRASVVALALSLSLGACDSGVGPEDTALRVVLSSQAGSSLAASLAGSPSLSESAVPGGRGGSRAGNGPISLDSIEAITVSVEQVLVLEGAAEEADSAGSAGWVPLTVTAAELNLMALSGVQTLAELSADAGVTGPIAAVRLVFGTSSVTFKDGSTEPLFIPSGKITLETPELALDDASTTLPLTFIQSASVRKIIRTGRGLLMPPVFSVAGEIQGEEETD